MTSRPPLFLLSQVRYLIFLPALLFAAALVYCLFGCSYFRTKRRPVPACLNLCGCCLLHSVSRPLPAPCCLPLCLFACLSASPIREKAKGPKSGQKSPTIALRLLPACCPISAPKEAQKKGPLPAALLLLYKGPTLPACPLFAAACLKGLKRPKSRRPKGPLDCHLKR